MITSSLKLIARVAQDFVRLGDARLILFVRNFITLMAGLTELYKTPQPPLAEVTTSVNAFETTVQEALNGGKLEIGARNAARADLLSLVRQEANYVQANCNTDVLNIIAAGFTPVRGPSSSTQLPPPANARMEYTKLSGELRLVFSSVSNSRNYSVQTALSAEGPWEDRPLSTGVRVVLTDLPAGKVVWARVRANGAKGPSDWAGPVQAMVI